MSGAKIKNVWIHTTTTPYTVMAWCSIQHRNGLIVQEMFHVNELFKWWSSFGVYKSGGCGFLMMFGRYVLLPCSG